MQTIVQISVHMKIGESVLEENIASALRKKKFRVVNIYLQNKNKLSYEGNANKFYCLGLESSELKGFSRIAILQKVKGIIDIERPEIIICHRYKPIALGLRINRKNRFKKCILVNHGIGDYDPILRRILTRILLLKNCTMVACSPVVSEYLQNRKFPSITINNAIDVDGCCHSLMSREEARNFLQISDDRYIFGTIGRICEAKDHQTLVSGFIKSQAFKDGAILIIIGEGKLRSSIEALIAANKAQSQVILAGNIVNAKRLLKAFDGFLFTSITEGLPLSLLEAMAAQQAIIGSDIPAVMQVIKGASLSFTAGDSESLCTKIDELYASSDSERGHLGEMAFRRVKDMYDIENFNLHYQDICAVAS